MLNVKSWEMFEFCIYLNLYKSITNVLCEYISEKIKHTMSIPYNKRLIFFQLL